MRVRFISNLILVGLTGAVAGLVLLFSPSTVRWLGLGLGCATALLIALAFLSRGRGATQRTLDALGFPIAGWTIVASVSFGGATLRWLTLGEAGALCALGLTGLIAHEVIMERAVTAPRWRARDPMNGEFASRGGDHTGDEPLMVG